MDIEDFLNNMTEQERKECEAEFKEFKKACYEREAKRFDKNKIYEDQDYAQSQIKLARAITDSYIQLSDETFDYIDNVDKIDIKCLGKIDAFMKVQEELFDGYYQVNGEKIDVNKLIDYLTGYQNHNNDLIDATSFELEEYDHYYCDELEDLENVLGDYNYTYILCLFIKCVLTKDDELFKKLLEQLIDREFCYDFITDEPREFWIGKYESLLFDGIDEDIYLYSANIDHFYRVYKPYIAEFLKICNEKNYNLEYLDNNFNCDDLLSRKMMDLYFADSIYDNIDNYDYDTLFPSTKKIMDNYSRDELKQIIDNRELFELYIYNLTDEEKFEVGYYGFCCLCSSLDELNIFRITLLELKKRNHNYSNCYKLVNSVINKFLEDFCSDYEADEVINTEHLYRSLYYNISSNLKAVYENVLRAIDDNDVDDLMQQKNQLTLYYRFCDPQMLKNMEEIIDEIYQKIIDIKSNSYEYKLKLDKIVNSIHSSFKEKIIKDEKALSALAMAEVLYDDYIVGRPVNSDFDYSMISCGYYKSIELLANFLFFIPYKEYIENQVDKIIPKMWFGKVICTHIDRSDNNLIKIKPSLEIGALGRLFVDIDSNLEYREFIEKLYPRDGICQSIKELGEMFLVIRERRNTAVHDCKINYNVAVEDKKIVYDENEDKNFCNDEIKNIHNLFHYVLGVLE